MIKLKDLYPNQPSFIGVEEPVKVKEKRPIVESNIKVLPADKINSKIWRNMKYDLRDQFDELVKVGEDFGVFASAQGTHRMLKQIKRLMDKI